MGYGYGEEARKSLKNWSDWIGHGDFLCKISRSGNKVIIKPKGQITKYPHWTFEFRNGELQNWHESQSKHGSRFGNEELTMAAFYIGNTLF